MLELAKVANPVREHIGWMLALPKSVEHKVKLRALRALAVEEQNQPVEPGRTD